MKEFPKRKQIRLENYDYATPGAYFVTICTAKRKNLFWNNVGADIIRPNNIPLSKIGKTVEQSILQTADHYKNIKIDKYCIMPDHIHLIISINADKNGRQIAAPTLSTVIGQLKRWVSMQIGESIWQKSFYEHKIRNKNDYNETWKYIENNPLKYTLEKTT